MRISEQAGTHLQLPQLAGALRLLVVADAHMVPRGETRRGPLAVPLPGVPRSLRHPVQQGCSSPASSPLQKMRSGTRRDEPSCRDWLRVEPGERYDSARSAVLVWMPSALRALLFTCPSTNAHHHGIVDQLGAATLGALAALGIRGLDETLPSHHPCLPPIGQTHTWLISWGTRPTGRSDASGTNSDVSDAKRASVRDLLPIPGWLVGRGGRPVGGVRSQTTARG